MPKPSQPFKPITIQTPETPKLLGNKQKIHFLSLRSSSADGYEQALNALQGTIICMATTNEHLIVVTHQ